MIVTKKQKTHRRIISSPVSETIATCAVIDEMDMMRMIAGNVLVKTRQVM